MSHNAEPQAKMADLNRRDWEAATDAERTAVHAAIKAYADSPGTSENVAMLRACRAFIKAMRGKA